MGTKSKVIEVLKAAGITEIDPAILNLTLDKARRMTCQFFGKTSLKIFFENEFEGNLPTFYRESAKGKSSTVLREQAKMIRNAGRRT